MKKAVLAILTLAAFIAAAENVQYSWALALGGDKSAGWDITDAQRTSGFGYGVLMGSSYTYNSAFLGTEAGRSAGNLLNCVGIGYRALMLANRCTNVVVVGGHNYQWMSDTTDFTSINDSFVADGGSRTLAISPGRMQSTNDAVILHRDGVTSIKGPVLALGGILVTNETGRVDVGEDADCRRGVKFLYDEETDRIRVLVGPPVWYDIGFLVVTNSPYSNH
jgi:hypothetical protein